MTLVKSTVEQTGSAPLPLLATDLALVTRPGNPTKHAALQALLDLVLAQLVGDRGQVIVDGTGLGWSIDISGQTADASPDLTADYVMTWDQSAGVNKKVRLNVLLPDGSKGDIVVSSNNGVWTIASGAVSLAKLANMATASLLGRASAGSGSPEVLGVGGGLELVSSALRRAAITGDVAIAAGANTASLAKLVEYYATLATGITTGNAQPLSLADSIFTGKSAGGALNGNGTAGVVASSFASLGSETGTGASQGGLGSAASATQPYNATDFPGQRGALCYLAKQDGDQPLLIDMLSTATAADRDAPVYAYLSFRSDLGANLKWRLWFYYRRASDGLEVPFTPDTSLTNISIGVPIVDMMGNLPVSAFSGRPQFGQMAAAIGAKAIGTTQLDDLAATTAKVADQAITYAKLQNVSATARMLGRKTAGAGSAEELSLSDVLDLVGSAAQGDILYRGASAWVRLAAATAGQFFQTGGAGANPLWATPPNAVAGGAAGYLTGADKLKIDNGPANVSAGSSLTASVTVSNSTADTAILTFTAGASTLAAGAVFEFDVWGDSDNVVTAAPVLNFWVKDQGGTKRVTVSFTHTTTAKTNQGWHLSGQIDIRTLTATGTDRFSMKVETMTTATPTFAIAVNNADVTIDTTASHTFTLGMTWGTANAANIARAHLGYFVQIK